MTDHAHDWRLAGRPKLSPRHLSGRGGRLRGWFVLVRCYSCGATKYEPVSREMMELRSVISRDDAASA